MKKIFPYLFVAAVPVAAALFLVTDRAQQKADPRPSDLVSISQKHAFSEMAGQRGAKTAAGQAGTLRIGDAAPAFRFTALDGTSHTLAEWKGKLPLVMMADTTCPCVRAYDGRMKALVKKFPDLRVVYVFPSPLESRGDVQKYAADHAYAWPVVFDSGQPLMTALGGRCTTESFLFDRTGTLRYHGRIDDNIYDEANVHVRDLENAIQAVTTGKTFVKTEVPAYGCVIPKLSGKATPKTHPA